METTGQCDVDSSSLDSFYCKMIRVQDWIESSASENHKNKQTVSKVSTLSKATTPLRRKDSDSGHFKIYVTETKGVGQRTQPIEKAEFTRVDFMDDSWSHIQDTLCRFYAFSDTPVVFIGPTARVSGQASVGKIFNRLFIHQYRWGYHVFAIVLSTDANGAQAEANLHLYENEDEPIW